MQGQLSDAEINLRAVGGANLPQNLRDLIARVDPNHGVFYLKDGTINHLGQRVTWTVSARRSQFGDSIDFRSSVGSPFDGTGLIPGPHAPNARHVVNTPQGDLVVQFGDRRRGEPSYVTLPGSSSSSSQPLEMQWFPCKRSIRLELDVEDHPVLRAFEKSGGLQQVRDRVTQGFQNAHINLILANDNFDWVPSPPSGPSGGGWTKLRLDACLKKYFQSGAANAPGAQQDVIPSYHMLICHSPPKGQDGMYGVMYDDDGEPREGAACFYDLFTKYEYGGISIADNIAYTIVHEIGHALNLYHSFSKEKMNPPKPNRPEAISFMNYETDWAGAVDRPVEDYWAQFVPFWNFDDDELSHLWHAKPQAIRPGQGALPFGKMAGRCSRGDGPVCPVPWELPPLPDSENPDIAIMDAFAATGRDGTSGDVVSPPPPSSGRPRTRAWARAEAAAASVVAAASSSSPTSLPTSTTGLIATVAAGRASRRSGDNIKAACQLFFGSKRRSKLRQGSTGEGKEEKQTTRAPLSTAAASSQQKTKVSSLATKVRQAKRSLTAAAANKTGKKSASSKRTNSKPMAVVASSKEISGKSPIGKAPGKKAAGKKKSTTQSSSSPSTKGKKASPAAPKRSIATKISGTAKLSKKKEKTTRHMPPRKK